MRMYEQRVSLDLCVVKSWLQVRAAAKSRLAPQRYMGIVGHDGINMLLGNAPDNCGRRSAGLVVVVQLVVPLTDVSSPMLMPVAFV